MAPGYGSCTLGRRLGMTLWYGSWVWLMACEQLQKPEPLYCDLSGIVIALTCLFSACICSKRNSIWCAFTMITSMSGVYHDHHLLQVQPC